MVHRREASLYGSGAPTTVTPEFIGQIYYDTTDMKYYGSKSKTTGDWILLGDMLKSVYDNDEDNLVDNAEQLNDGTNIVTAAEARDHIDNHPASLFGSEFQYLESNSVSISTSTSFINKLDFDTTSLPAGTYRIEATYGWSYDSNQNDFESRVTLDDDTDTNDLVFIHRQEPKDSGGTGPDRFSSTGTNQRYSYTRYRFLTLTAGVHNIKLDFRTTLAGAEASIWDATISIYRVA